MTRFARAHGSKSSNERLPEAATSWNVMKQQLEDKLQSSEPVADSAAQKIWKSSDFDEDVWNRQVVKWADLEDKEFVTRAANSVEKNNNKLEKKSKKKKHKKSTNEYCVQTTEKNVGKIKKRKDVDCAEFDDTQSTGNDLSGFDCTVAQGKNSKKTKKSKKMKKMATNNDKPCSTNVQNTKQLQRADIVTHEVSGRTICDESKTCTDFTTEISIKKKSGKKRKRNHSNISVIYNEQLTKKHVSGQEENTEKVTFENDGTSEANDKLLKKKHKQFRDENKTPESGCLNSAKPNFHEEDTQTIAYADADTPTEKKRKKKKHKGNVVDNSVKDVNGHLNYDKQNFGSEDCGLHADINSCLTLTRKREKKTKKSCQKETNRKIVKKKKFTMENRKKSKCENEYLYTTVLHINGKDIEIVKFEGFPIKKEDAENLIQLKKKMIANGIPESEIKATMKLERRKAEKTLAREKKKVCFHCRNSGHVLSECPELGKTDTHDPVGTGICFKCGSTEHKHFECRVTREQEFRYAKCFICNEQGHIARQCPDNPRGLYPKGGACHLCGDVTHLKKDCPDLIKEKEEKTIKLPTLSNKALEALEDDDKNLNRVSSNYVNKRKTVKF